MMRQLPLATLFTFEVAARHLNFTKTADELHITQGAVSQQIRQLEEKIGFKLFERYHRRLTLTAEGARLALQLNHNFTEIDSLINELKEDKQSNILTLSVMPSFASKWLIPRLGDLQSAYPDMQLRIQANDKEVNFRRDKVDVAIVHSHLYKGNDFQVPLIKDKVFPVCSPEFAKQHNLLEPQQLVGLPLLNDDSESRFSTPYVEWENWLQKANVKGVKPSRAISFNRGDLAIQAAVAGQGIALGRTPLVMDDIQSGQLIKPFSVALDEGLSYLFVCPQAQSLRREVKDLLQWLLQSCFDYEPESTLTSPSSLID